MGIVHSCDLLQMIAQVTRVMKTRYVTWKAPPSARAMPMVPGVPAPGGTLDLGRLTLRGKDFMSAPTIPLHITDEITPPSLSNDRHQGRRDGDEMRESRRVEIRACNQEAAAGLTRVVECDRGIHIFRELLAAKEEGREQVKPPDRLVQ